MEKLELPGLSPSRSKRPLDEVGKHPRWCGEEGCPLCEAAHPDANPHCPQCKGVGFAHPILDFVPSLGADVAMPDRRRLVVCHEPGCMFDTVRKEAEAQTYDDKRGLSKLQTLTDFDVEEGAHKALQAAKNLAKGSAPPLLFIQGGVGCGKTHLANAVALKLAQGGRKVRLWRSDDLLEYLREGIDEHELRSRLIETQAIDVLVIDDFASEKYLVEKGAWALEKFEQIIDHRYHAGMVTMMTTNNNWDELPERIRSRFQDKQLAVMVWNKADDYRKKKLRPKA